MSNLKKLVLYSHISSGNRGCEATARTTIKMLGFQKENNYIFTNDVEDERYCGTHQYSNLVPIRSVKGLKPATSVFPRAFSKLGISKYAVARYLYKKYLNIFDSDTLALSTGGDLYCYDNTNDWLEYLNREIYRRKAVNVLWACSIENKRITNDLKKHLLRYSYIIARESITYENLRNNGIKENVKLYPDPAFLLEKEQIDLSRLKDYGNFVGINISIRTNGGYDTNTLFFKNTIILIKHILENTDMSVLLIPHVYWKNESDLILLNKIVELFPYNERVLFVEPKLNCCQLKYIISKCRFYLGARTHSVIAAYSSLVPTLALGYSIKSAGISRDIFGDEKGMVLSSNQIEAENDMVNAFELLREKESWIKSRLEEKIPEFEGALKEAAEYMKTIPRR
ncbi:polysaccharide pyruvyl transferase family protein [Anaerosacchariphilus polymeriproducens]|uniref:Polysaccharide pyruvyl transferase family protein n=1 Tax=Anaerosacchariphilus polymeriproducens TaxID=1812858 RepID=A0A371AR04_9FIRM|nr:polysaccharide pyruvyl transferase family protein [Anaerosacchariphilus polymeriproducens]RDU22003.1 polysaccharide pyruvyl transferase family protein [Anaerosacchariphilus polymeriproducens]